MAPPPEERHALVIGNNQYRYLPALRTAATDALAVSAALRSVGVSATEHIDVDRRMFLRARALFAEQIRGGGIGIFWFSGHGVQLLGRNILLPTDAEVEDEHTLRDDSIDLDDLIQHFTSVSPSILIMIIDACRTNPFENAGYRALLRPGLGNPREVPTGVLVVYSAGPNEIALDSLGPEDQSPNGLFARELIPLLLEPGIPFTTLIRRIRSSIREKAIRFTGREQVPLIEDRLIPDFTLVPGPVIDKSLGTVADADKLLRAHAGVIQKIVFPHRETNPIAKTELLELIHRHAYRDLSDEEFEQIISAIVERNLIPGLIYDDQEMYLLEEHARWKAEIEHDKKVKIGRRAAAFVRNGMKVFLDAGSTTEEIIKVILRRIENRALTRLVLATTSINIADMISDMCVQMGFDDDFSAISLYVPGGKIRPSTQAIVSAFNEEPRQIVSLGGLVGGFDLAFIGVNGIDNIHGFTTHLNTELANKGDIISVSRQRLIVGDSSKVGIILEGRFGGFEDDIKLIIDDDPANEALQHLMLQQQEKILSA